MAGNVDPSSVVQESGRSFIFTLKFLLEFFWEVSLNQTNEHKQVVIGELAPFSDVLSLFR